jgi:uncharacterized membrane protein
MSIFGGTLVAKPTVLFGGEAKDPIGIFYALCAAVFSALAYIIVRLLGTTHKIDYGNVMFFQAIGQIFLSIPCLYISGQKFDFGLSSYQISLIVIGGTIGAFSQAAMTYGMQREKSATATAMRMSDILFGYTWEALFTNDSVDPLSILGALFVTGSILLIIVFKKSSLSSSEVSSSHQTTSNITRYEKLRNPQGELDITVDMVSRESKQNSTDSQGEGDVIIFNSLHNGTSDIELLSSANRTLCKDSDLVAIELNEISPQLSAGKEV